MSTIDASRAPTLYDQIVAPFPKRDTCQRVLMVGVAICSILALIPPLRVGAAIAMRGVALLTSLTTFHNVDPKNQFLEIAQNVARCAILAFGIAALATASPLLLIISIAMDTAMQAFLCVKAFYEQDYAVAGLHLAMLTINTLALAGLVTGSWQLMVTAAAVSLAAMIGITTTSITMACFIHNDDCEGITGSVIDILCNLALTATGCAALAQMIPIDTSYNRRVIHLKNDTDSDQTYYYPSGKVFDTLKPGEDKVVPAPFDWLKQSSSDPHTHTYIRSYSEHVPGEIKPPISTSEAILTFPSYSVIQDQISRWISIWNNWAQTRSEEG